MTLYNEHVLAVALVMRALHYCLAVKWYKFRP